jgi:hypothetical protein
VTSEGGDPSAPAPDLWADDPSNAWGAPQSWIPEQREVEPTSGTGYRVRSGPDAWYESTPPAAPPAPPLYPPAAEWSQGRHSHEASAAASTHPSSPPAVPAPATTPAIIGTPRGPAGADPARTAGRRGGVRTGVDTWARPEPAPRSRAAEEDEFPVRRHDEFGDEPAYGPVLGYTAGWFGIPAVFYLVWLVTLDGDRQGMVWRQFVASLPWLFTAVILALAVAGLLRWAVVGWRALTLSFAAAVIGAGVTTIAHSLAL